MTTRATFESRTGMRPSDALAWSQSFHGSKLEQIQNPTVAYLGRSEAR